MQQRYPALKILIIDDGSTDNSREIIEEYAKRDERITFIAKEHWTSTRRGQGYINLALQWANDQDCELFAILDTDDYLVQDFCEQVIPFFSRPEIGFVRVGCYGFSENNPEGSWVRPLPMNHPAELLKQNKVFISSPFRLKVWENTGDWDDNISWSDWDFWIRATMIKGWNWATCNQPLFWHRSHEGQLAASSRTAEIGNNMILYLRAKHEKLLRQFNVVPGFV